MSHFNPAQRQEIEKISRDIAKNVAKDVADKKVEHFEKKVGGMIEDRISRYDFKNTFQKMWEHAHLSQIVMDEARRVVPQVSQEWTDRHLSEKTKEITFGYMKSHLKPLFQEIIANDKDVNGFISEHLKEVEKKVEVVSQKKVEEIVDDSTRFNPIFQAHLDILSNRNEQKLLEQSVLITQGISGMDDVRKENIVLRKTNADLNKQIKNIDTRMDNTQIAFACGLILCIIAAASDKSKK